MQTQTLSIAITAAFQLGDYTAHVEFEDAHRLPIVLRKGRYEEPVAQDHGRPVRLWLSDEPPPEGEAPLSLDDLDTPGQPSGPAVNIQQLYSTGVEIPEDGVLSLQLQWLAHCDADPVDPNQHEKTRFGSYEHTLCAEKIGLDAEGNPLNFNGLVADFDTNTRLDAGNIRLRFGEVIALAGDFYAHLDARAAADFSWAWPKVTGLTGWITGDYRATTLVGDSKENVQAILDVIDRDKNKVMSAIQEFGTAISDARASGYPARRYLALASQNHCHFASQPLGYGDHGNEALSIYRAYHRRALQQAESAGDLSNWNELHQALVVEAFACHFLTDLFASGHIRTPRRLLGERMGVITGGLINAMNMHGEDNKMGLWCTTRMATQPRVVWRAYGDGALCKLEAKIHLAQIQEAVRLSVAEVFARFCGATIPADQRAEDRVPVPLKPGELPGPFDRLPSGGDVKDGYASIASNHYPMYIVLSDGALAQRSGSMWQNQYMRMAYGAPRSLERAPI